MKSQRKRLSAGDFAQHARNPALVQKPSTERRKNGAAKIQRIKDEFFSDDSLKLVSSTLTAAALQLEGFSHQRRGRDPIQYHPLKLSFSLLERVENKLFKLAHKPLINSLTSQEKKQLLKLRDESRASLAKIVNYELPDGDIKNYSKEGSEPIKRVFDTHLNPSSIPNYEKRLDRVENGNIGDVTDSERELLHAAGDFNSLKSDDLREALEIPLEQMKGLANKVWFKLNQVLGETNHHKIVQQLYKKESDDNVLSNIKNLMQKTLRGRVDVNGARQGLEKMYQEFKHGSHKALTFSRAKIIAALKFSKIFLQNEEEKQALPESILVTGDKDKIFNISRSEHLPELNRIGNMIKSRHDLLAQAA